MALGAASSDVLRLMMGKGLALVGIGTVIGLAMGFAVERLMNSPVFDAGSVDIVAYAIVVPSLLLFTMLAVYVPAVLVVDAMTDRDAHAHRHCIEKIFPRLGETDTTTNVLKLLHDAPPR
jgi:predicted lysophospholipase L1 biosynthesis ABC-type transport system permease subunit